MSSLARFAQNSALSQPTLMYISNTHVYELKTFLPLKPKQTVIFTSEGTQVSNLTVGWVQ